ncbi:MAG: hypothetical protein EXQ69_03095 [Acidimicrobiia bacterium]|nr:hypothetical protein [Acidimicrobiia bacterium]
MAAYVVKVTDPALRSQVLGDLLDRLVGDEDRGLVVETFTVPKGSGTDGDGDVVVPPSDSGGTDDGRAGGESSVVSGIVNAAQSPPFMTAKRIVVVYDHGQLTVVDAEPVVTALDSLLDTTDLVFVAGTGRVAKNLADALKSAEVVGADSEKTQDVLVTELARVGLSFRNDASKLVTEHLGEDAGRLPALLDLLAATFGPGVTLTAADVEPYLGDTGSVPTYMLTNAIEEGDVASALETLNRLLTVTSPRQPKPLHPLQVLAILAGRYRRFLRLDDPSIRTTEDAHAALGGKGSSFPAKKALSASRSLGIEGMRQAVDLLHQADLDLKGATALSGDAVIEVLVARLAALHGRSGSGRKTRPREGARL